MKENREKSTEEPDEKDNQGLVGKLESASNVSDEEALRVLRKAIPSHVGIEMEELEDVREGKGKKVSGPIDIDEYTPPEEELKKTGEEYLEALRSDIASQTSEPRRADQISGGEERKRWFQQKSVREIRRGDIVLFGDGDEAQEFIVIRKIDRGTMVTQDGSKELYNLEFKDPNSKSGGVLTLNNYEGKDELLVFNRYQKDY